MLSASRLRVSGQGAVEVGLTNAAEALQISSRQGSVRYDLTLSQVTRKGAEALQRSEVTQQPGASRTVQPRDWQQLKSAQVEERWRALDSR